MLSWWTFLVSLCAHALGGGGAPWLTVSTGGCGQMFESVIVSPTFQGKTGLARHRLANTALKEEIASVHAWSQKLYTPAEWEKRQAAAAAAAAEAAAAE